MSKTMDRKMKAHSGQPINDTEAFEDVNMTNTTNPWASSESRKLNRVDGIGGRTGNESDDSFEGRMIRTLEAIEKQLSSLEGRIAALEQKM